MNNTAHIAASPQKEMITSQIVNSLRNGDHKAYEKVYLHYKRPLSQFVYKLTGSREQAEEIVQDVFVSVWEKREQIDPSKNIRNYLYVIAKNKTLKHIYQSNRYENDPAYEETIADSQGATDRLDARDVELLIEIAVRSMPEMRRNVFELFRKGLDNEQIAAELGMTKDNAAKHLSRARKDVRDLVYIILFLFS